MRILYNRIAPVDEHGTHNVVCGEVLVVGVDDRHDGLLVCWVADVWSAVKVPNDVTCHFPCILIA